MEREELLRVEWRETASEMEAGGKDHLCGDWSPGPTAQCWLSFNPPLLPPQRRRETGKPDKPPPPPLGFIRRVSERTIKQTNTIPRLDPPNIPFNVLFYLLKKKRPGR